jgi:cyclopropane fatty-acyl-phospholipid synthase-like methyltransferase
MAQGGALDRARDGLRDFFFGATWVYTRLRPRFFGGLDYSPVYAWLEASDDDVILDVGSGFGDSLRYLDRYRAYHGFDVQPSAVAFCNARLHDARTSFHPEHLSEERLLEISPTRAVCIGLFHHLTDTELVELLALLARAPRLQRIISLDGALVPGARCNNLVARMDRGRYVRSAERYRELLSRDAFRIAHDELTTRYTGRRWMYLYAACLVRSAAT